METTGNNSQQEYDRLKNTNERLPESKQTDREEQETEAKENEELKKELDTNFPLSGGGTEPYFDNEGA